MTETPRKILYISGPFSSAPAGYDPLHATEHNINEASRYALMAARRGWVPFCPHKNTAGFQHTDIPYEFWIEACLEFVRRSDAILMIPGWESSPGAKRECALATLIGKPVYYFMGDGIPGPETGVSN